MDIEKTRGRYEEELYGSIIPFWEKHCIDREYGGYFTSLDRDGSVYDTEKYMWMQWRIVYMFAKLAVAAGGNDRWLDIARGGYDFLTRHGKAEDGTYYFALNRKGVPSMAPYNIYSDCFAAMGAAAMFKATGEAKYRDEANSAMRSYMGRMDNPKGRWEKAMAGKARRLSHGQFMMLANLAHEMQECLGSSEYNAAAGEAVKAVTERFWNPGMRVLFENINCEGPAYDLDSCEGRMVNPGHGLESMWFMLQHAEQTGDRALVEKAADIVKGILDFGTDREYGGIFYFMDALHKPHLELQWDMKLWWPHCEALISCIFAYRLTGDRQFLDRFEEIDDWTWSHFRDPLYPEWFAYLNRRGEPTHMLKGGKWKTFFHLPRCLFIVAGQLGKLAERK